MMKKFFLLGAVLPVMFLGACGEGWDSKLYNGFPYDNARTAGHGVEYVRANMMPKKGPKVEALKVEDRVVIEPKNEPEPEPVVVEKKDEGLLDNILNSGEKFFREKQKK